MKRRIKDYLMDILIECDYLLNEVKNLDYDSLIKNEHLKRSFVRSLEIIGEAAKKIPNSIRKNYPQIKWKEVAGMRDKLIHEYFGVDYRTVWKTIEEDIPFLKEVVKKILEAYKEENENI